MEVIKRDAKERLKLSETLMALLLKLDPASGVDDAVGDFRKAVIRKAILLQDRIEEARNANNSDEIGEEWGERIQREALECVGEEKEQKPDVRDLESETSKIKEEEEVVQKIVEDNERMMASVAELLERNAAHSTRLIRSLLQRVEHLEKAINDESEEEECSAQWGCSFIVAQIFVAVRILLGEHMAGVGKIVWKSYNGLGLHSTVIGE